MTSNASEHEEAPRTSVAQKLDRLLSMVTPAGASPPSYSEIARAIDHAAGSRVISSSYIWKLHRGEATNPRLSHLMALADYFNVPTEYFLNDAAASRIDEQLKLLEALKVGTVNALALRAHTLSPESLRMVNSMIDRLSSLEHPKSDAPTVAGSHSECRPNPSQP
ncbi:helix-turn-helix domain-containing protein [Streptomyces kronopolitis]